MTSDTRKLVSRALAIGTACFVASALILTAGDRSTHAGDLPFILAFLVGMGGMAVVGAFLSSRAPTNPIGLLFQVAAFLAAFTICASEYGNRGLTDLPSLPGVALAGLINQVMFAPVLGAIMTAILLFPDGRVPTRRWTPVLWLIWGGACLAVVGTALGSETFEFDAGHTIANPFSIGPTRIFHVIGVAGGLTLVAGSLLAVGAVVVRFLRSQGVERQQLRWLAWAAVLLLVSVIGVFVTGILAGPSQTNTANDLAFLLFICALLIGFPLATTVAVLRYRLYELDIVVKKTAIYSIIAIVLTVLYLVLVGAAAMAGLGTIPALVIFVLTFNPVRKRTRRFADRLVYGKRATPFEVLSEFSERVGETYSIDDVLPRMTQLLSASTGAKEVRAWIRAGRSMRSAAVAPSDAGALPDVPLDGDDLPSFGEGVHAFPVSHQGELLGAITLAMAANDPMDVTKERLAQGVASQAGLALRNVRLVEDLRASRRRIVTAQDERAKTLERDIHDGAQQQLVALTVKLRLAEQLVERDPATTAAMLRDLQGEATGALEDLRDLARGIYPPLLADKGLSAALQAQARKAAITVDVHPDGVGRYPPDVESTVYFCVLEALNNAAKYAEAGDAVVELSHADGALSFEVRDEGRGFDPATTRRGTGVQGMADRLDAIGGEFEIETSPGHGTRVRGRVPISSV